MRHRGLLALQGGRRMGRRAASLDQAGLRLGCHRHRAGIDVYKRQAGARPDQRGDENKTPLEFLLNRDFEFAVRMTYLPRLVDRAQTCLLYTSRCV